MTPPPYDPPEGREIIEPRPRPIVVIDDIPSLRTIYQSHLADAGFHSIAAKTAAEGLELFRNSGALVVVLDMFLPDRDGLDLMREMLRIRPAAAVVIVTADLSIERAVTAMRAGAQDFLVKPVSEDRLISAIRAAMEVTQSALPPGDDGTMVPGFIGVSAPMLDVYSRIRSSSKTRAPVFVWGEDGSGKRLCAGAIHALSDRASGPFIKVDCAAISPDRFADIFFGEADSDQPGLAQRAHGGTLYLAGVSELDPAAQAQVVHFIDSAQVQPTGGTRTIPVDVRIIASSVQSPVSAVRAGRLREALYHRLYVVPIRMPALRERREDIMPITLGMLQRYSMLEKRSFSGIAPRAETVLRNYDWPGNVRQLMNVIHAVTVLHDGEQVSVAMLPSELGSPDDDPMAPDASPGLGAYVGRPLAEIERMVIEGAITRYGGSVPRAAEELDVAPSTIYRKLGMWRKDD